MYLNGFIFVLKIISLINSMKQNMFLYAYHTFKGRGLRLASMNYICFVEHGKVSVCNKGIKETCFLNKLIL